MTRSAGRHHGRGHGRTWLSALLCTVLLAAGGAAVTLPASAETTSTTDGGETLSAGVPSESPGTGQVKLVVRAGADRLADGSVAPLPGASFDFYRVADATTLTGGTAVGSCTTDGTGLCGAIVSTGGSNRAYYYAVQTAAPAGWSVAATWGSSTDYVRYNTGRVDQATTVELPGSGRSWPSVRDNPVLTDRCGLDVGMVVDLSNSLHNWETDFPRFEAYKVAATDMVTALEGSPTSVGVYAYATYAPTGDSANTTLAPTSVSVSSGATTVRNKITGLVVPATGSYPGYSNWDEGLHQAAGRGHDAVVFLSDGDPTTERTMRGLDGNPANLLKVEQALHSANAIKAGGTTVIVAGVGDEAANAANRHRYSLVAGPTEGVDYRVEPTWGSFGLTMQAVGDDLRPHAYGSCDSHSTVTLTNDVRDSGGNTLDPSGWHVAVTAVTGATATPTSVVTDATGEAVVTLTGSSSSTWVLDLVLAQRPGFVLERVGDRHAVCTAGGAPLTVTNLTGGFRIEPAPDTAVECSLVNTAVASGYAPTTNQVKVGVRSGGDRLADGSVAPLQGALFDLHQAPDSTTLTGGARVGTCTTASDGTCGVIVSLASTSGYFYAAQTAAPAGWTVAETWGSSTNLVRFNTGQLSGGSATELPGSGRSWPTVRDNPAPADRCGLDVAVVVDLSNSVVADYSGGWKDDTAGFAAYKDAAAAMVDVLEGTPTAMSVYTFGTAAPADGSANVGLPATSVTRSTGASAVRNNLLGLTKTPTRAGGYANWDQGLHQAAARGHDVVVFLTDGDPSADRVNPDGLPVSLRKMENAIHSANAVKAGGARVVVAGVGPDVSGAAAQHRLSLISGPAASSDYHVDTSWPVPIGFLAGIALEDCAGTVSIIKDVRAQDGTLGPGAGWDFAAALTGTGTVHTGTTDAHGSVAFTVQPEATGATVTETPGGGYGIEPQSGYNAVCATTAGTPVTVTDVTNGFSLTVPSDAAVVCSVVNAYAPSAAVVVDKTSDVDPAGPERPVVPSGQTVTWSYTVTNTGNVTLTDLLVVDDQGVAVTCPGGNPVPQLDPGASVTCTGTASVHANAV